MVGEFGGVGAFVEGKEWKPKSCHTYLKVDTPHDEATTYIGMAQTLQKRADHISASVCTLQSVRVRVRVCVRARVHVRFEGLQSGASSIKMMSV